MEGELAVSRVVSRGGGGQKRRPVAAVPVLCILLCVLEVGLAYL